MVGSFLIRRLGVAETNSENSNFPFKKSPSDLAFALQGDADLILQVGRFEWLIHVELDVW